MLNDVVTWIEAHEVTVGLLEATALFLVAWFGGLFSYFRRFRARPSVRIQDTASFVFLETVAATGEHPEGLRASFVINASLVNSSNEKIVLDQFELSYRTRSFRRSFSQRLLRLGFPSRPRKRLGESEKYMGVWFTDYPLDELKMEAATGVLEPKDHCAGYLLFTSYTFGAWNPKIEKERIAVRLRASLTSGTTLKTSARLRVTYDAKYAESFSPGLPAHVAHESTWNHDLSLAG